MWLAGFFYGHQPYSDELLRRARKRLDEAGLEAQLVNVPLGHPGDSLGAKDGTFPLTAPPYWRMGQRPDGKDFAGTSLHPPATNENAAALRRLRKLGFRTCFLDDDFRLARGPGEIGVCFCEDHRKAFVRAGGYLPSPWDELVADVGARRLTPLLRAWWEFTCAELSASFQAQRRSFRGELGVMVMYLASAEKAGIRLPDYRGVLFRVGELMFDDGRLRRSKAKRTVTTIAIEEAVDDKLLFITGEEARIAREKASKYDYRRLLEESKKIGAGEDLTELEKDLKVYLHEKENLDKKAFEELFGGKKEIESDEPEE